MEAMVVLLFVRGVGSPGQGQRVAARRFFGCPDGRAKYRAEMKDAAAHERTGP
jgi:hypothetical protein